MDKRSAEARDVRTSLTDKIAFLSSPRAHEGENVDVRETHMAMVFLAGDRAYKLKKPVRLPFLDYSTLAARGRICSEEVRLNRRLAPDVYLRRARLTRAHDGALAIDGAGRTVEWLVLMRRLPEERMLDRAISTGSVGRDEIEAVGHRLARFYRETAAEEVDPVGHLEQFARELRTNQEVFSEFGHPGMLGAGVSSALLALLGKEPELLTDRVKAGRIIEGHGDMRPEHVCLEDPPVIIDCLEFSRALRLVDPFDEISFLSMECAVLGARWIGPMLLDLCAPILQDRPSPVLLSFYACYRAALRARQALAHLLESTSRTPEKWLPLARRYLEEAEAQAAVLFPGANPSRRQGASMSRIAKDSSPGSGRRTLRASATRRDEGGRPLLFALGDSGELGERVALALGHPLTPHEERDFEDGEHKARALLGVRGADVYVLHVLAGNAGVSVNDRMVKLLFFISACREHGAARVTALVPYLAYARKDRQTKRRDPVTTRYVAQLFEAAGADRVVTLDVHNVAAFQNAFRCRTVHLVARSVFVPRIQGLAAGLPVTIVSPDSGGVKRAELLRRCFEETTGEEAGFAMMEKHRSRGGVSGDLFAGKVGGSASFIVDDMISTGGTILRAARECRARGAEKVVAMATHGLFGEGSADMLMDPALARILVTDSLPNATAAAVPVGRLDVVPIAPLLAETIARLHSGGSISELLGIED